MTKLPPLSERIETLLSASLAKARAADHSPPMYTAEVLAILVGSRTSTVSRHLKKMHEAGTISHAQRKKGRKFVSVYRWRDDIDREESEQ